MDQTTSRRQTLMALGAALVTVALWASAFVGIRAAGAELGPGPLALLRLAVGSLALGVVVLARRDPFPPRAALPGLLVCGLLWFGVYNVALNEAERRVDAGTAAMLVNVGPVLIAVLAGIVLGEGLPRRLLAGCAVALAGAVVIGLATSDGGLATGWGAALCLVAAAGYAGGVVAQKPLLAKSSALQVTWLACTIGAVACLPFAPAMVGELREAGAGAVAWAVYLGVFPHRGRLHDLALRAGPHQRRAHGGHHLPGPAPGHRHGLGLAGRDPARPGRAGRRALPGWRRRHAHLGHAQGAPPMAEPLEAGQTLVERLAAGAGALGVGVVDREAGPLEGVQVVDRRAAQVGGAHPVGYDGHTADLGPDVAVQVAVVEEQRVTQP
jgi:drug/metabolite transporter (DMT)-like permease